MAAVNFPNPAATNPETNAPYRDGWYNTDNGVTYIYVDAENAWKAATVNNADFNDIYINEAGGDHMEGPLTIGPDGDVSNATIELDADGSAEFDGNIDSKGRIAASPDSFATSAAAMYDDGRLVINSSLSKDQSPTAVIRLRSAEKDGNNFAVTQQGDVQMASQNGGPLAGFRNLIINGDTRIWQRGVSFTEPGNNAYMGVDRFYIEGPTSVALIRSTTAPSGFDYSVDLSATSRNAVQYGVEIEKGQSGCFNVGSTWTWSVWSTEDLTSSAIFARFRDIVADVANSVDVAALSPFESTGETSNGFTRYKTTFTVTGSPNPSNVCINLRWTQATGSFTGVQLEPGPVATPFEHRPIATELALCERYYQITAVRGTVFNRNGSSFASLPLAIRTQMRTNPASERSEITINQRSNSSANTTVDLTAISSSRYARLEPPTNSGTTESDIWQVQTETIPLDAEL